MSEDDHPDELLVAISYEARSFLADLYEFGENKEESVYLKEFLEGLGSGGLQGEVVFRVSDINGILNEQNGILQEAAKSLNGLTLGFEKYCDAIRNFIVKELVEHGTANALNPDSEVTLVGAVSLNPKWDEESGDLIDWPLGKFEMKWDLLVPVQEYGRFLDEYWSEYVEGGWGDRWEDMKSSPEEYWPKKSAKEIEEIIATGWEPKEYQDFLIMMEEDSYTRRNIVGELLEGDWAEAQTWTGRGAGRLGAVKGDIEDFDFSLKNFIEKQLDIFGLRESKVTMDELELTGAWKGWVKRVGFDEFGATDQGSVIMGKILEGGWDAVLAEGKPSEEYLTYLNEAEKRVHQPPWGERYRYNFFLVFGGGVTVAL